MLELDLDKLRLVRDFLRYEDVTSENLQKFISHMFKELDEIMVYEHCLDFLHGKESTNLNEVSKFIETLINKPKT